MRYLIDGYNLAHKITLPAGKVDAARLEAARSELLTLIAEAHGDQSSQVTVVFDTRRRRGVIPDQLIHGIDVHYAIGEQADDMIERMIQSHPSPKQLIVVSDDHRIQNAAHRRRCQVLSCEKYLDQLERPNRPPVNPPESGEKPTSGTTEEWVAAFGEIDEKSD